MTFVDCDELRESESRHCVRDACHGIQAAACGVWIRSRGPRQNLVNDLRREPFEDTFLLSYSGGPSSKQIIGGKFIGGMLLRISMIPKQNMLPNSHMRVAWQKGQGAQSSPYASGSGV